jgi:hypothetical protein
VPIDPWGGGWGCWRRQRVPLAASGVAAPPLAPSAGEEPSAPSLAPLALSHAAPSGYGMRPWAAQVEDDAPHTTLAHCIMCHVTRRGCTQHNTRASAVVSSPDGVHPQRVGTMR